MEMKTVHPLPDTFVTIMVTNVYLPLGIRNHNGYEWPFSVGKDDGALVDAFTFSPFFWNVFPVSAVEGFAVGSSE